MYISHFESGNPVILEGAGHKLRYLMGEEGLVEVQKTTDSVVQRDSNQFCFFKVEAFSDAHHL
jgi:hypothetical protein